jgi:RHS repeat-associated protein
MVWLDHRPVAALDGEKIYDIQSDHLGTPRALVERGRDKIVWKWSILGDAFGADAPNEDPDGDGEKVVFDMRFPGQRYDLYTRLFQNGFRDYDSSTGRYAQSDPIGLNGGISSYAYAFSSPYGAVDPSGLVVRAKFYRSSGVLQIYDQDRPGTLYDVDARSGGKFASNGQFNGDQSKQIPVGEYHILGDGRKEWFRLDAADGYPLNDVHEQSGRDAFRLHPGTNSLGCVTVDKNADQYGFYSQTIAPLIRGTRSVQTTDYSRKSLTRGVLPFSMRFGAPAREPIVFYGTLEVLP